MEHNNSIKSMENEMSFEEKWGIIQEEAINKIIDNSETGVLTSEQYMRIYTIIYNICYTPTKTGAQSLYDNYKKTFEDYISAKVLPSLRGKTNEALLQELVNQFNNLNRLTLRLSKLFSYMDRYFFPQTQLPSLKGTSYSIFYELVHGEVRDQIEGVMLSMIKKEPEGVEIDPLVKNVLDIYIEMGEGSPKYLEKDFEGSIYSNKSNEDASMKSVNKYIQEKVEECSSQNKDRTTPSYSIYYTGFQVVQIVDGKFIPVGRNNPVFHYSTPFVDNDNDDNSESESDN